MTTHNIFLAGGTGYLGTRLIAELLQRGHSVRALAREGSVQNSAPAAVAADIKQFVYVSVAHPAPVMKAYWQTRAECETVIRAAGLNATILRPWYVLGPGHRWPYILKPMYWLFERLSVTRETAQRLGFVTLQQMINALVNAVENPVQGLRILEVKQIRRF